MADFLSTLESEPDLVGLLIDGDPTPTVHVSVLDLPGQLSPPPPEFRLLIATPLNSNTVRVFLSREPKHTSPLAVDDSRYRLNWTLSVLDPGPFEATAPVVTAAENPLPQPDEVPGEALAWSIDLRTDRRLLLAASYLVVAGSGLVSKLGVGIGADPYDRGDFPGIIPSRERRRRRVV